jgi:hypothetical protein
VDLEFPLKKKWLRSEKGEKERKRQGFDFLFFFGSGV